jgi:hypothetical protein
MLGSTNYVGRESGYFRREVYFVYLPKTRRQRETEKGAAEG